MDVANKMRLKSWHGPGIPRLEDDRVPTTPPLDFWLVLAATVLLAFKMSIA